MKRVKTIPKSRYNRKVIIYFLMCCLVFNTSLPAVLATPSGASPDYSGDSGGFSVTYKTGTYGNTTLVNVDTTHTIINWESLNTKGGAVDVRETLAFTQETLSGSLTNSAVLNRVSGPATQFNGDLIAPDMRIFIVNPAGVLFGSGSTVNVTQLVASGLNMSNNAFNAYLNDPANNMMEFIGGNGDVTNRANITADRVYLIGKKVYNFVPIQAPNGLVVMAAGDEVRLYENGSAVSVVVSDFGDGNPDIRNSGYVSADNGKIVLAAGDTFSRAISNVSILAASGGEVTMQAANIENNSMISVSNSSGNGGSVALTGTEEVLMGAAGKIEANAGENGDGGSVTIQTDGLFRMDEGSSITANGGSVSGNGGSVTITCDDFEILGDILASPGNKNEEPGKLEINTTSDVFIADGANAGATNTLYENDIESISQEATSLVVNTEGNITVQDITDDEIAGQFGDIELHATGDDSAVTFADNTIDETPDISDTIRTTLGDIVIEAGSGGINAGNLSTGKDISDEKPTPGQILLSTNNGGDITTGDLTIRDGWGLAEINVDSSGNLTVNGDITVGSESDILNIPNGQNAHAAIYLNAGDNLELNGNVAAYARGIDDDITVDDKTLAEIRIFAGTAQDVTGDAFINGDITADAKSSSQGTAEAIIEVDAWGNIEFAEGAEAHAVVDGGAAEAGPGTESEDDTSPDGDHAQIIINAQVYPTPPLIGIPDEFSTPKSEVITVDVLVNDTQDGEPLVGATINSYTEPTAGTLTPTMNGDKIVGFTYNPPEDLSTLTFDENGKATVTFTYVGKVVVGEEELFSEETTVTITLVNNLPVAVKDLSTAIQNKAININVLINDTDQDLDDVLTALEGTVTPKNGTLVLNEDGTFTYTPNKGFIGNDSFTYSVTDGSNTSSEVEVKITVTEEPPPPLLYIHPAPGLDRIQSIEVEISGCPALSKWVAKELGIDEKMFDIWITNSLASTKGIYPYDTYSRLRKAALILQDADGSHIAALAQVINDITSSAAPPTEEQMAAIADAITRNTDEDSYYAVADEYLDALVTYTGILSSEMGISTIKSAQFVTYKYLSRLTQDQNVGVSAFLAGCLAALGG
jgi:filamentous hemagglutinin family protein